MPDIDGELQVIIRVVDGELKAKEFILPGRITIGSSYKANICIPHDKLMAGSHAQIVLERGEYWIEDMGSSSGTFVDGEQIDKRVLLPEGSKFRLGGTNFEFKKVEKARPELGYVMGDRPEGSLRI